MKSLDLGRSKKKVDSQIWHLVLQAENDQHIFACGNVRLVLEFLPGKFRTSAYYIPWVCVQMRWQFGFSCVSFLIKRDLFGRPYNQGCWLG